MDERYSGAKSRSRLLVLGISSLMASACAGIKPHQSPPQPTSTDASNLAGQVVTVTELNLQPNGPNSDEVVFTAGYENGSSRTFISVDVWCRALDSDGYAVGAAHWSLSAATYGPVEPGFRARKQLRTGVPPGKVKEVKCKVLNTM